MAIFNQSATLSAYPVAANGRATVNLQARYPHKDEPGWFWMLTIKKRLDVANKGSTQGKLPLLENIRDYNIGVTNESNFGAPSFSLTAL
jgi:hypothetical protein